MDEWIPTNELRWRKTKMGIVSPDNDEPFYVDGPSKLQQKWQYKLPDGYEPMFEYEWRDVPEVEE